MKLSAIITVISLIISINAMAGLPPVAIIEDIQAKGSKLSFMDYVNEGRVIQLGSKGKLIIGYLHSCRRETITGGTVTIGSMQSRVDKGELLREDVECDGGNAKLSGQQAATSGALAFRGSPKAKVGIGKADLTIYGTAPVIRTSQANASITIERMDKRSQRLSYQVKANHIDLADHKVSLVNGGLYRITVKNGASKTFKVDKYAETGKISIVSRLIDL